MTLQKSSSTDTYTKAERRLHCLTKLIAVTVSQNPLIDVWYRRKIGGFGGCRSGNYEISNHSFQNFKAFKSSIDVSELHKDRRLPNFETLKLLMGRSGIKWEEVSESKAWGIFVVHAWCKFDVYGIATKTNYILIKYYIREQLTFDSWRISWLLVCRGKEWLSISTFSLRNVHSGKPRTHLNFFVLHFPNLLRLFVALAFLPFFLHSC